MLVNKVVNFIFELGHLRRIKHEGWRLANVEKPDSVAEHSLRAAQIGYLLAKMENHPNPHKITTMLLFHDIGECRIGDIHKLANRYVVSNEDKAVTEQCAELEETGNEILSFWNEMHDKKTIDSIIAKDADYLEQAFMAKEYLELGHKACQSYIDSIDKAVKTKSAKKLIKAMKKTDSYQWWQGLKKLS